MSLSVVFVADKTLSGRAISCFGGDFWDHMAIMIDDETVIDARSDVIRGIPAGVEKRPVDYLWHYSSYVRLEMPCDDHQRHMVIWALKNELHKPYDRIGILDFALCRMKDRNWRDRTAWFCDELAVYAMEIGRVLDPVLLPIYRLKPGNAALMCQQKKPKISASRGLPKDIFHPRHGA